jgi:uncharacterized membrane protein (UPF0127 family)
MARLQTNTLWLITAAAAALVLLLQFCPAARRHNVLTLTLSQDKLVIDVADSPERRLFALGMLDRFRPGRGLLLVFDDGTPPRVWSKALQVEADLLWLDETRQIVGLKLGARPCTQDPCPEYAPERGAVSVLVLPPGSGRDAALAPGQTVFLQPA